MLSGYLITSVLRENGDLRRFYMRRARRLLPALLVWLAALTLVGVITLQEALPPLFYVSNWAVVDHGLVDPLAHTWSLATEEQFYLLWPFVLLALRRPPWLLVLAIVGGAGLRLIAPEDPVALVASRFDALAWGCLLGLGVVPVVPRIAVVAAIVLLVVMVVADPRELWLVTYGFTAIAAAAFVITSVLVRRDTGPLAVSSLMVTGRISYGLYLWHFPFALEMQRVLYTFDGVALAPTPGRLDDFVGILAAMAATFACATVSWFLVERWFLVSRGARRAGSG